MSGSKARGRPILIVDDDVAVLDSASQVLTDHGYRVVRARDGAEALREIGREPPALIVLDVQMPGVDGPTFARELRKALRHVPLVILTAAADARAEADRSNAEAYLRKPFDAGELARLVDRFAA
jgi:CheY-like chemotaxis protein